ncbi:RES family NAD+ phosphorylase [Solemya pervernicosa gill symbiont]|uniref:RES family NAD+ phosphorylase n=1 Tax=Solemya pervernicosa gill symbiont TaxID=642797 RepID=UPI00156194BD|nr:RES family NAD+ phosphorylase [Solemya pervernicosa gill symbiont]
MGNFIRDGLTRAYTLPDPGLMEHGLDDSNTIYDILMYDERIFPHTLNNDGTSTWLIDALIEDSAPSWHEVTQGSHDKYPEGGNTFLALINGFVGESSTRFSQSWNGFVEHIKHTSRFFDLPTEGSREEYLKDLGILFEYCELLLPTNTSLWRARVLEEHPLNPLDIQDALGPPPPARASHSRMSPTGITCFYLGDSPDTCIAEIRPEVGCELLLGKFITKNILRILDLTKAPNIAKTSIFQSDYDHDMRWAGDFIGQFIDETSRPISSNDSGLEYLPTQALSEYIRSKNFHGIKYNSSQNTNSGTNYTFFLKPKDDYPWFPMPGNSEECMEFHNHMYLCEHQWISLTNVSYEFEKLEARKHTELCMTYDKSTDSKIPY